VVQFSGSTILEQPRSLATPEQLLQQSSFGLAGEQPGAELAEHGGVVARVGQLEAQQVLPVDAGADRLGRRAVGEVRAALEHGDQGQPPGREGGLLPFGVEVGKVVVAKDRPELIAESEVGMALGEGGAGDWCGGLGDGRDGAGLQGPGDTSGRLAASCKALQAKCHMIPISFVPHDPDHSGVIWTEKPHPLPEVIMSKETGKPLVVGPLSPPSDGGNPNTMLPVSSTSVSPWSITGSSRLKGNDLTG
jgi:hypothetical protein